jgi:hypothetical protein
MVINVLDSYKNFENKRLFAVEVCHNGNEFIYDGVDSIRIIHSERDNSTISFRIKEDYSLELLVIVARYDSAKVDSRLIQITQIEED